MFGSGDWISAKVSSVHSLRKMLRAFLRSIHYAESRYWTKKKDELQMDFIFFHGSGDWIRTSGLVVNSDPLYR